MGPGLQGCFMRILALFAQHHFTELGESSCSHAVEINPAGKRHSAMVAAIEAEAVMAGGIVFLGIRTHDLAALVVDVDLHLRGFSQAV